MYKIQSVIFDRNMWKFDNVIKWAILHELKVYKIGITKNEFRVRQIQPERLKKLGYTNYHNKKIGDGIQLVIAYKD
jgi:hypothetical protein